tara:strand:+ start:3158 stop:4003 length:846 start_codon:yes stop_codon:yes gene_type:complete
MSSMNMQNSQLTHTGAGSSETKISIKNVQDGGNLIEEYLNSLNAVQNLNKFGYKRLIVIWRNLIHIYAESKDNTVLERVRKYTDTHGLDKAIFNKFSIENYETWIQEIVEDGPKYGQNPGLYIQIVKSMLVVLENNRKAITEVFDVVAELLYDTDVSHLPHVTAMEVSDTEHGIAQHPFERLILQCQTKWLEVALVWLKKSNCEFEEWSIKDEHRSINTFETRNRALVKDLNDAIDAVTATLSFKIWTISDFERMSIFLNNARLSISERQKSIDHIKSLRF